MADSLLYSLLLFFFSIICTIIPTSLGLAGKLDMKAAKILSTAAWLLSVVMVWLFCLHFWPEQIVLPMLLSLIFGFLFHRLLLWLEKESMRAATKQPALSRPTMQVLSEKFDLTHPPEIAFNYSALLENSGHEPIRVVRIYFGYGLASDEQKIFQYWFMGTLLQNFYLPSKNRVPVELKLSRQAIDEFLKEHNAEECKIYLAVEIYNEKNEIVEARRQVGSKNSKGQVLPLCSNWNILF